MAKNLRINSRYFFRCNFDTSTANEVWW